MPNHVHKMDNSDDDIMRGSNGVAGGNKNGFNRGENRLVKMIFAVLPAKTGKNSF